MQTICFYYVAISMTTEAADMAIAICIVIAAIAVLALAFSCMKVASWASRREEQLEEGYREKQDTEQTVSQ